jgi:hypothetical protein
LYELGIQFAQLEASWSEYDAVNREIQLLRSPTIPHYLDFSETLFGFCLVQEYRPSSLAQPQQWTAEAIEGYQANQCHNARWQNPSLNHHKFITQTAT